MIPCSIIIYYACYVIVYLLFFAVYNYLYYKLNYLTITNDDTGAVVALMDRALDL